MGSRFVTHTRKNDDGDITMLCNPNEPWSPQTRDDAIRDIESGVHSYYTGTAELKRANIVVISGSLGKYLFTDRDGVGMRHLLNLPDC